MGSENIMQKKMQMRAVAVSVIIFSFLAHGYRFFNNMYSHDSLLMIYQNDYAWQVSLGRIFQPILIILRGSICNPWLICAAFVFWMILAVYNLVRFIDIKSKIGIVLISGIMICNVIITASNASYLPWVDFYGMACFAAIAGLRSVKYSIAQSFKENPKKKILSFLLAIILFILTLGIYQAYICLSISLAMVEIILIISKNNSILEIVKKSIHYIISLAIAGILYLFVWKIVQKVFNVWTSDGYNGLSTIGDYSSYSVIEQILYTYKKVFYFFWDPEVFTTITYHGYSASNLWVYLLRVVNILVWIYCIFKLVIRKNREKLKVWQLLLQMLVILLLPFGMNIVCFISKGMVHTLMVYGMITIYLFAILLTFDKENLGNDIDNKIVNEIKYDAKKADILFVFFIIMIIVWNNIVYSNQVYLKKELITEATISLMNRIVDDVEDYENYEPGVTKVALYGSFEDSDYVTDIDGFEDIAIYGMGKTAVTYQGVDYAMISYIINANISLDRITNEEDIAIVNEMPSYPSHGSIGYVGDILVVKISD